MTHFNFFQGTFGFQHIHQDQNSITFNPTLFQAQCSPLFNQSIQKSSDPQINHEKKYQFRFPDQLNVSGTEKVEENNFKKKKKAIIKIKRKNRELQKGLQLSLVDMIKRSRGM